MQEKVAKYFSFAIFFRENWDSRICDFARIIPLKLSSSP